MSLPDLESYDWIVLNSSGGKDSQAMMDYVAEKIKEKGLTSKTIVVHASLGKYEWPEAMECAGRHAAHYGFRFEVVKRSQNGLLDHVRQRGRWPAKFQRYCTSDHKRGPIWTLFTRLARETGKRPTRILNCMGMRADESNDRALLEPFEVLAKPSNSRKHVDNWLPIHGWNTWQVWNRIELSGVTPHWAYSKGMPRLSCMFCIFATKSALMVAGKHNRELLNEYVAVEKEIGHTFRHKFPIASIAEALDRGEQAGSVEDWRA